MIAEKIEEMAQKSAVESANECHPGSCWLAEGEIGAYLKYTKGWLTDAAKFMKLSNTIVAEDDFLNAGLNTYVQRVKGTYTVVSDVCRLSSDTMFLVRKDILRDVTTPTDYTRIFDFLKRQKGCKVDKNLRRSSQFKALYSFQEPANFARSMRMKTLATRTLGA